MVDTPELLTATQAADYLGVTRQRVNQLTKFGYGKRYGSVWLFTKQELEHWKIQPHKGPGGRPAGSKTDTGSSEFGGAGVAKETQDLQGSG